MSTKKTNDEKKEVHSLQPPDFGRQATGTYEFFIAGEPMFVGKVSVFMGCTPPGCYMSVSATTPVEALTRRGVGIGLPLDAKPGTYNVGHDGHAPFANYFLIREGPNGSYMTSFDILRGTITLDDSNQEHFRIKGSFEYHAWAYGQTIQCLGTFDVQEDRPGKKT
ncbi:hypothetical protein [Pseudomonas viridiflava]|uniref:hypothetical protein n=1 Tax=Pseudomonas viridiflava TaxID=33069 RepID=UPI000F062294|nr:hypothetical protein [Pseudomonas viridiflava]